MLANEEHVENAKALAQATSGVTNKDIVDFLGDPEKVAALRDHIADSGEEDDAGSTTLTSAIIIGITVAASC